MVMINYDSVAMVTSPSKVDSRQEKKNDLLKHHEFCDVILTIHILSTNTNVLRL